MSRTGFAILMASIVVLIFGGMWIAWRARSRRDSGVQGFGSAPTGEVVAVFPRASYVSTTPVGSPFERVAIPGLRYKGFAEVTVRRDIIERNFSAQPSMTRCSARSSASEPAGTSLVITLPEPT